MTIDTTKLFNPALDWADRLGPESGRTLPEIILTALAAAIEDAETVEADWSTSARERLNEHAGQDVYAMCRQLCEFLLEFGHRVPTVNLYDLTGPELLARAQAARDEEAAVQSVIRVRLHEAELAAQREQQ